jgi:hypothetical protein
MQLIFYSKPGCHLCEGLQEKLAAIQVPPLQVEIRDITTQTDWFQRYQYEIPVLYQVLPDGQEQLLPRFSPRSTVSQVAQILQKYDRVHS